MDDASGGSLANYLDVAWRNIGHASIDMDLPDIINHADIEFQWPSFKMSILQDFAAGRLKPLSVEIVDLPKDQISVRPLARLDIARRILYEALVIAIADEIESTTSNSVYSSKWWKKGQRMLGPTSWWVRMQRAARQFHIDHSNYFLASADVSSFFEHIDIDILADDIRRLNSAKWATDALINFLKAFNGFSNAWGIPQGPDMSGSLANLYLAPLDAEFRRGKFRYFRYSDDVLIFGKDWADLRKILVKANRTLRHRHLNLAASKTKILSSDKVLQHLEDKEKDAINYGIDAGFDSIDESLHDLFDRASQSRSSRDVKYCLTKLSQLEDDYAVKWLSENFVNFPHIARQVLVYLEKVLGEDDEIGCMVMSWLTDVKLEIYPYAQSQVFSFLIRNEISGDSATDVAWDVLLNRNSESFLREMSARYLGLHSKPEESGRLKEEYQVEPNSRIRRALLVACYESGQATEQWLGSVADSDSSLSVTANYLRSMPNDIPYPQVEGSEWQ